VVSAIRTNRFATRSHQKVVAEQLAILNNTVTLQDGVHRALPSPDQVRFLAAWR
jgi:hypothetical protein